MLVYFCYQGLYHYIETLHGAIVCCSVVTDGEDGNGLEFEKKKQKKPRIPEAVTRKLSRRKLFWFTLPAKFHLISSS